MLKFLYLIGFRGEMDIITVFGTVVLGSSPSGSTKVNEVHFCAYE